VRRRAMFLIAGVGQEDVSATKRPCVVVTTTARGEEKESPRQTSRLHRRQRRPRAEASSRAAIEEEEEEEEVPRRVVGDDDAENETILSSEASARRYVASTNPWLSCVPFISAADELETTASVVAKNYGGEFCWAASFEPAFVSALMARGFLTMSQRAGERYALLPKLHRERCGLRFEDRHTSKSVRRHSKKFAVTCDAAFEDVVRGVRRQHGDECWFYPPLVAAFRAIRKNPPHPSVAMHTFECWLGDDLVAGEVGYAVGDVYTSLSGFSTFPCAGSVQCAATAAWLQVSGFSLWDLGMELPYKLAMGAKPIPRLQFLHAVDRARDLQRAVPLRTPLGRCLARPLIDRGELVSASSSRDAPSSATTTSDVSTTCSVSVDSATTDSATTDSATTDSSTSSSVTVLETPPPPPPPPRDDAAGSSSSESRRCSVAQLICGDKGGSFLRGASSERQPHSSS